MRVEDKVVVVTGAASGIGRALALRFAQEGASAIVVSDIDEVGARRVAGEIGDLAIPVATDVANEDDIVSLIETTEGRLGPIDLFCSNAGVYAPDGLDAPDEAWRLALDVNVMAHVLTARHLVPRMASRGGGYLLHTASAAGLLSHVGSVTYTVTKHATVAFAEWLSITQADAGIRVSVLCPQAVRTAMLGGGEGGVAGVDGVIDPGVVAGAVIDALADERFWVLPHPEVAEYVRRKGDDIERWLSGMRRLYGRHRDG